MNVKKLATILRDLTDEKLCAACGFDTSAPEVSAPKAKPAAPKPAPVEDAPEAPADSYTFKVCAYVTGAPDPVATSDVARDLSIDAAHASAALAALTKGGQIVRIGQGRGTRYTGPTPAAT